MIAASGRRLVRGLQGLLPPAPEGLRILCYHLVGAGTDSPVDVPAEDFERQMRALAESTRPVALDDALDQLGGSRGESLSVVTFDDAYRNFLDQAWPVLERYRIPVTMFVPTGFVEGECAAPLGGAKALPAVSWHQLRELNEGSELFAVGAHTRCHPPDLRALEEAALRDELAGARALLEQRLGVPVDSFCYPRGLWDRRVEGLVRETYELAVVGGGRRVTAGDVDPCRLPRTSVRRTPVLDIDAWSGQLVWLEEAVSDLVRRRLRGRRR